MKKTNGNLAMKEQAFDEAIRASKKTKTKTTKKSYKPDSKSAQKIAEMRRGIPAVECKPNAMMCKTIIANASKSDADVMFAIVPIELMDVDYTYQRMPRRAHINELKYHWNHACAGVLIVSHRNNRFYVVDGQHRMFAAKELGFESLYCLVHTGLSQTDEADIFTKQDEMKRRPSGGERITSGSVGKAFPEYKDVREICEYFGVKHNRAYPTELGALGGAAAAVAITRANGKDMLRDIFWFIESVGWHMKPKAYSGEMLRALRNVFNAYGVESAFRALEKICASSTPHEICVTAQAENMKAKGPTEAITAYLGKFIGPCHK